LGELVVVFRGGAELAPRVRWRADYTLGFLKIRLYVYKCIIFVRRKVLPWLGLQLFSEK
jgi:hypothetical protein